MLKELHSLAPNTGAHTYSISRVHKGSERRRSKQNGKTRPCTLIETSIINLETMDKSPSLLLILFRYSRYVHPVASRVESFAILEIEW